MASTVLVMPVLLLFLGGLARVVFLLGWRQPVRARLVDSIMGPGELAHERRTAWADRESRGLLCKVAYQVDGCEYRSDVWLMAGRGDLPSANPLVWIDPDDPARATGLGLRSGLVAMALSLWLLLAFAYP